MQDSDRCREHLKCKMLEDNFKNNLKKLKNVYFHATKMV